jgi:plastocyanin
MPRRSSRRSARGLALAYRSAVLGLVVGVVGPGAAAPAPRPATHTVIVEATSFQPDTLAVRAGDTVVWLNKDPFPHTATSSAFDSKVILPEASWKYTPRTRGDFMYVCTLHPTMKGRLRVE